jgi:hypothetical protein
MGGQALPSLGSNDKAGELALGWITSPPSGIMQGLSAFNYRVKESRGVTSETKGPAKTRGIIRIEAGFKIGMA